MRLKTRVLWLPQIIPALLESATPAFLIHSVVNSQVLKTVKALQWRSVTATSSSEFAKQTHLYG